MLRSIVNKEKFLHFQQGLLFFYEAGVQKALEKILRNKFQNLECNVFLLNFEV